MKRSCAFISVFISFSYYSEAQQNSVSYKFKQNETDVADAININPDSLNQVDEIGRKQGYWKVKKLADNKWVLKEEGHYNNNLKSGYWKDYYLNGNLKSLVFFTDGRPNGSCEVYHENGLIKEKGVFAKNKWVGDYTLYYNTGQIQHQFHFNEKGKREGKQYFYNENGIITVEGDFVDGRETTVIEYYESGKLKEKKIHDSLKLKFYENGVCKSIQHYISKKQQPDLFVGINNEGKPAHYISEDSDILHGHQYYYDKEGHLSLKLHYVEGRKEGMFYFYYPSGSIKIFGDYKNNHMSGERKYYDENGKLIRGLFKFYHPNGQVERDGLCIDGKPEGAIFVYDENGKIVMSVEHKNGKPDGKTYFYNKLGQPYLDEEYKDGVFKESKTHEFIK